MNKSAAKGSKNRLVSFGHAFNGIFILLKEEPNARIHFLLAILVIVSSYFLGLNYSEWLWIALCISLVFTAELLNTAIENICDLITTDYNPKIKAIKDLSAGAVLITTLFALITASIILLPKVLCIINLHCWPF